MQKAFIYPSALSGSLRIPPSKSYAHRAIICAALAQGVSTLAPIDLSEDIAATLGAVQAMGVKAEWENYKLTINGSDIFSPQNAEIDCRESGSTLRFLLPVAAAGGMRARFIGSGKLPERPLADYLQLLPEHGVVCRSEGGLPLCMEGQLRGGTFAVSGHITSQFITGLLLALPLLAEDSSLILTSPLESQPYVDMTLRVLRDFGVLIHKTATGFHIPSSQTFRNRSYTVESDWSQAAFFLTAGALGAPLALAGLNPDAIQGDAAVLPLLTAMGAEFLWRDGLLVSQQCGALHAVDIDATHIPDLVPILCVAAIFCEGTTRIRGAKRLRLKESDRLQSLSEGLKALGVPHTLYEDGMDVIGQSGRLEGGVDIAVQGYQDHRIVMAFTIAALFSQKGFAIHDAQSIAKSYPAFFADIQALGGHTDVINMG